MEQFGLQPILLIVKEFGIPGLVLLLWYLSMKSQTRMLDAYRSDTQEILNNTSAEVFKLQESHRAEVLKLQMNNQEQVRGILLEYQAHMVEQRRMYDNNIILVKDFNKLSADQQQVIILNTQAIQRLADTLKYNQLCPNVKVESPR